jgi:hypothetical protein
MNKETQNKKIDKYLSKGRKITPLKALKDFGVMRLASRINDLKNKGKKISREMIPVKTRFCGITRVAEYKYVK